MSEKEGKKPREKEKQKRIKVSEKNILKTIHRKREKQKEERKNGPTCHKGNNWTKIK